MTLKHIDHLFQDNRYDLDRCLHNPLGWLEDERRNMEREYGSQISNPGRLLHARQGNGSDGITDTITRGNFYTFLYEPRSARTLPYFDVMPLTLVFETGEGWFSRIELPLPRLSAKDEAVGAFDGICDNADRRDENPI